MRDPRPENTTCPACHHPDQHSPMAGCLWQDAVQFCDCTHAWTPPKTTAQAQAETDAAVAQVDENADAAWQEQAANAVRVLAIGGTFTPDDVWEWLTAQGVPAPREPRALGPVIRRALEARIIHATGYSTSRRRHGAVIRVYEAVTQ